MHFEIGIHTSEHYMQCLSRRFSFMLVNPNVCCWCVNGLYPHGRLRMMMMNQWIRWFFFGYSIFNQTPNINIYIYISIISIYISLCIYIYHIPLIWIVGVRSPIFSHGGVLKWGLLLCYMRYTAGGCPVAQEPKRKPTGNLFKRRSHGETVGSNLPSGKLTVCSAMENHHLQ